MEPRGGGGATAVPTSVVPRSTLVLDAGGGQRFDLACYSASRARLRQMRLIYTSMKSMN